MSVRLMTAVFDHSASRLADRLVLLVIADSAHDDGTGCFRGKESIARMAGVSRTTVTEAIGRLEALGEIVVERRPGRSSLYSVVLPGVGQNPAGSVGQNPAQGRPPVRPTPGHPSGRDPLGNSLENRDADNARRQRAEALLRAENEARLAALEADPGGPPPEGLIERLKQGVAP